MTGGGVSAVGFNLFPPWVVGSFPISGVDAFGRPVLGWDATMTNQELFVGITITVHALCVAAN